MFLFCRTFHYLTSVLTQSQFLSLSDPIANTIKKDHIRRLKAYNELRDVGLRLTQLIADSKQCKQKDIFEEMGYTISDE